MFHALNLRCAAPPPPPGSHLVRVGPKWPPRENLEKKERPRGLFSLKKKKNVWARPSHQKVEMGPFVGLPPSFLYWPFLSLFILFQSLPGSKKKKKSKKREEEEADEKKERDKKKMRKKT